MEIKNYTGKITIDDSVDFCAYVVSSWHLIVLYAALLKLVKKLKKDIKGYVLISPFNNDMPEKYRIDVTMLKENPRIKIDYYYNINNHLSKKEWSKALFNLCRINLKQAKSLYLLSSFDYNFTWCSQFNFCKKRQITLCRTDEGSGTYIPKRDFYYLCYPEDLPKIEKKVKASMKAFFRIVTILYAYFSRLKFESFFLLEKRNGFFLTDEENACFIRNFVFLNQNYGSKSFEKNQILILKDFDWNLLSLNDSILFYQQIIDFLTKKTKKNIYIKRHPCDKDSDFATIIMEKNRNVRIIDSENGIENLYLELLPCIVFGGDSTATYTIRILFSAKVINFTKLYNKYKVKNNVRLKNIIRRNKYFANNKDNILIEELNDERLLEVIECL